MSIRIKLLLLAGLSTLICGLSAAYLVHTSVQLRRQIELFLPATSYLNGIAQTQTGISRQMKAVLTHILTGKPASLGEFHQENKTIDQGFELWTGTIQHQLALGASGEEEDLGQARRIQHHHQSWVRNMEEVLQLADSGRRTAALELFSNYSETLHKQLFPTLAESINDGVIAVEEAFQSLLLAVAPLPWLIPEGQKRLKAIRATVDEVIAGHRLNTSTNRQYVALMEYIASGNQDALTLYQRLIGQSDQALEDHLQAEQMRHGSESYGERQSNKLVQIRSQIEELGEQAIKLKQAQQTEAAIALLGGDYQKIMSGIFLPELSRLVGQRSIELIDLVNSRRTFGLATIAVLLMLLLVLALRTSYKVVSSLNVLQKAMDRVTAGDYSGEIALRRRDEFGRLAGTFNQMTRELQHSRSELADLNLDLEQQLSERTAQTAALNKELQTFNSMLSHDLRNPLTVILGLSQLLQDRMQQEGKQDESKLLERVVQSSITMTSMLEALQQLGAMSEQELRLESVDLSQMVHRQILECQTRNPERRLISDITPGIQVKGDSALLLVAISNLVSNAWKFTARQTQARIVFGRLENGEETICYLRDNGVGFDMEAAESVFTPFHRLHDRIDFPGTGLGLATVAKVMGRHGWRIWAESSPGEGATFFFTYRPAVPVSLETETS